MAGNQSDNYIQGGRADLNRSEVLKTCAKCTKTKAIKYFDKNKSKKDGHDGRCKNCISEAKAKTYKKNKKKLKERAIFSSSVVGQPSEIYGQEFARTIGSAIKEYLADENNT